MLDLVSILEKHRKWLNSEPEGERADLRGANLSGADLRGADLRGANLSDADLSDADLRGAYLRGANLSGADLSDADLSGANLSDADLRGAKLEKIKEDYFSALKLAVPEVPGLYKAICDGRIDGTKYEGECACLVGTIANIRHANYKELGDLQPNSARPSERWFLGIRRGDTPENNPVSAITKDWTEEFMRDNNISIPSREVVWRG